MRDTAILTAVILVQALMVAVNAFFIGATGSVASIVAAVFCLVVMGITVARAVR